MTTLLREAAAAPKPKVHYPRFPPPAHRRRWGVLVTWVRESGDGCCWSGAELPERRPWWLLGLVLIITRPGPQWRVREVLFVPGVRASCGMPARPPLLVPLYGR